MPLSEKELLKRDAKRDVWQEALDAVREIKSTVDQKIAQLPAERQERVKARANELVAEELSLRDPTGSDS